MAVGGRVVPILGVTRTPNTSGMPRDNQKIEKKDQFGQSKARTLYPLNVKPLSCLWTIEAFHVYNIISLLIILNR